jgi:hypothetical protein
MLACHPSFDQLVSLFAWDGSNLASLDNVLAVEK